MNDTPHEDGPAVAKLFAKIDAAAGYRTEVPDEIAAMTSNEPDGAKPVLGQFTVIAPPTSDSPGAHVYTIHIDGRIEGFPEGSIVSNGMLPLLNEAEAPDDAQVVGPVNYAKKLHQAGEAAILIAASTCEAEFAQGNPCNIPEPILGWYAMTLAYQLLVLEATEQPREAREMHAGQLQAARRAFDRHKTPYATSVRRDIAEALGTRYIPKALEGEDLTYGGKLAGVPALKVVKP